jgi:hypothetical protein
MVDPAAVLAVVPADFVGDAVGEAVVPDCATLLP